VTCSKLPSALDHISVVDADATAVPFVSDIALAIVVGPLNVVVLLNIAEPGIVIELLNVVGPEIVVVPEILVLPLTCRTLPALTDELPIAKLPTNVRLLLASIVTSLAIYDNILVIFMLH
jgi:hypothetical protein